MTSNNVSVPTTFLETRDKVMDFFNQGALAHRTASSQEEWDTLWGEVLKKHGLMEDTDMTSLVYTSEEDRDRPQFTVIH